MVGRAGSILSLLHSILFGSNSTCTGNYEKNHFPRILADQLLQKLQISPKMKTFKFKLNFEHLQILLKGL